ncbi:GNAT family N-acetyltransferase, partial [Parafilimonas sp.]|uniref:GNAT family N-acetyltransferase n=1 Tax=Parafilimonas sp. TaxID=1969739 RepID=UPI0039E33DB9
MIFETQRLIVREFTTQDAGLFFRVNGNETLMKHIRKALSKPESDKFLEENIRFYGQSPNLGRWCVVEKAGNSFAGIFALIFLPFDDEKDKVQIGYALMPEAWGKGFTTELTKAGIDYYFILYCLNNSDFVTLLKNYELQNFPISKGTKRIKGPITKDGTG